MIMRCKINAASKAIPVDGKCPECTSDAFTLSAKGFIGSHAVASPFTLPTLPGTTVPVREAVAFIGPKLAPVPPVIAGLLMTDAELTDDIKARSTAEESDGKDALIAKCAIDGEPVKVKHKLAPVAGSVLGGPPTLPEGKPVDPKAKLFPHIDATGTCPECHAHVPLSRDGWITAHNRGNGPIPAPKTLVETSIEPTDMGSRVGDPDAGNKRRGVEIDGAHGRGVVSIPVAGENGDTKMEKVPGTLDNLRVAYDYWVSREPIKEAKKAEQSAMISHLRRRIDAAMDGTAKTSAHTVRKDGTGRDAAAIRSGGETDVNRGAAIVKGVTPTLRADQWARSQARKDARYPNPGRSTTLDLPLGRERVDSVVTVGTEFEIAGGTYGHLTRAELGKMTNTQRRRYWRTVREREAKAAKRVKHNPRKAATREIAPSMIGRATYRDGAAMEASPGKNGKVRRNTK